MTKQTNSIFRRLLMMLMLTASALQGRAANVECLTLTVSGKPVVIVLAEHPVITYKGNTLHVKTETTTIDSKRLKAEHPDLYEAYSKKTKRAGSLRITVMNQ